MLMYLILMHDVLLFVYRSHEQRLSVDGMVVQYEGQQEVNAMLAELPPLAVDSMTQVICQYRSFLPCIDASNCDEWWLIFDLYLMTFNLYVDCRCSWPSLFQAWYSCPLEEMYHYLVRTSLNQSGGPQKSHGWIQG